MKSRINSNQIAGVVTLVLSLSGCPKSEDGSAHPGHSGVQGKPVIRSVTPNRAYQKGGSLIEVSVGNIDSSSRVSLGDHDCTSSDAHPKSGVIFCAVPNHTSSGKVDLKVTNPSGESDQLTQAFEYEEDPEKVEKRLKDKAEALRQKIAAEEHALQQGLQAEEQKKKALEALQTTQTRELDEERIRNGNQDSERRWREYLRANEERKLNTLKEQQAAVNAALRSTQAANQAERQRLDALRQSVITFQTRVQASEAEATRLEQERARLQTQLQANQRTYQTERAAYDLDRAALDQQVAQDPVASRLQERDRLVAERAQLEPQAQAIALEVEQSRGRLQAAETLAELARAETARRGETLARLEREIEDAEASIIQLQDRQEALNRTLDQQRRAQFAAQQAEAHSQAEALRRAQADRNAALLARLQAEEAAEAVHAENPQTQEPHAAAANHGSFSVQSPKNIACQGAARSFSAEQLSHHRENFEDLERLIHASCSEFVGFLGSNLNTDVGNLTLKTEETIKIGAAMQARFPFLREGEGSLLYQGNRYQINSVFVSAADPYLFIERQNHSLDGIALVDNRHFEQLTDRIVQNARTVGGANDARIEVLKAMLSHMEIQQGTSADVVARKHAIRKRFSRLVSTIEANAENPRELASQLGLLTNILEGDSEAHCMDGLETQLIAAESQFLGLGDNLIKGFGDHISRTLRAFKSEFIQKHKTLYNPQSRHFAEKEAYTYTPIGLNKLMYWSMGLLGNLAPLQWPSYFPPNNHFDAHHQHHLVDDDRKKGLVSEKVFERLLSGGTIHFHGGSVTFEALTPTKMIRLLDQTARRGLSARSVSRDPELRGIQHGLKITPAFIQSQFHSEHPTAFMKQNPQFAAAINSDYENFIVMMDESHYFKLLGDEIVPSDAFWTEMLIHYGYISKVQ